MVTIRHHKTKTAARTCLQNVTPTSYGTPGRKLVKKMWKTKNGYTSSIKLKM